MSPALDASIHFTLLILALHFFLSRYNQYDTILKSIGVFLIVSYWFDLTAAIIMFHKDLANTFGGTNLFIYHIVIPIQYSIIAFIYYKIITQPVLKKIIIGSIGLF